MEYMDGGNLASLLEFHGEHPLTEIQIRWVTWNVFLVIYSKLNLGIERSQLSP